MAPTSATVVHLPRTVITASEPIDALLLLAKAHEDLQQEQFAEAEAGFRQVFRGTADADFRLQALLGWGTAVDLGARPQEALEIYSRYVDAAPVGEARDNVRVRVLRLLVYLERYSAAAEQAKLVDPRKRPPLQGLAIFTARALFALSESRLTNAERLLGEGRLLIETHSLDRVRLPPLDVAAFFYALGELRNRRAAHLVFDPMPLDFTRILEERCQWILDSQSAYSDAMRSEDVHWSSMSGVRVGQLYQDLHRDLMRMPRPPAVDTKEREQLFEGALRLRYAVLLKKALAMLRSTVALLDRSEQKSPWRRKAREALAEIEAAQQEEEEAIEALPYSRERLQLALDELKARGKSRSSRNGS